MAATRFYEKDVYFKDDKGNQHKVHLFTTKTRSYTTEHALLTSNGKEGTYKWVNRPWQSFDYCCAMQDLINKLPKAWQENATKSLIDRTEEEELKQWDDLEKAFKATHDSLSENAKAFFAEHAPMMESEEDVRTMTKLMALASIMEM